MMQEQGIATQKLNDMWELVTQPAWALFKDAVAEMRAAQLTLLVDDAS